MGHTTKIKPDHKTASEPMQNIANSAKTLLTLKRVRDEEILKKAAGLILDEKYVEAEKFVKETMRESHIGIMRSALEAKLAQALIGQGRLEVALQDLGESAKDNVHLCTILIRACGVRGAQGDVERARRLFDASIKAYDARVREDKKNGVELTPEEKNYDKKMYGAMCFVMESVYSNLKRPDLIAEIVDVAGKRGWTEGYND